MVRERRATRDVAVAAHACYHRTPRHAGSGLGRPGCTAVRRTMSWWVCVVFLGGGPAGAGMPAATATSQGVPVRGRWPGGVSNLPGLHPRIDRRFHPQRGCLQGDGAAALGGMFGESGAPVSQTPSLARIRACTTTEPTTASRCCTPSTTSTCKSRQPGIKMLLARALLLRRAHRQGGGEGGRATHGWQRGIAVTKSCWQSPSADRAGERVAADMTGSAAGS